MLNSMPKMALKGEETCSAQLQDMFAHGQFASRYISLLALGKSARCRLSAVINLSLHKRVQFNSFLSNCLLPHEYYINPSVQPIFQLLRPIPNMQAARIWTWLGSSTLPSTYVHLVITRQLASLSHCCWTTMMIIEAMITISSSTLLCSIIMIWIICLSILCWRILAHSPLPALDLRSLWGGGDWTWGHVWPFLITCISRWLLSILSQRVAHEIWSPKTKVCDNINSNQNDNHWHQSYLSWLIEHSAILLGGLWLVWRTCIGLTLMVKQGVLNY